MCCYSGKDLEVFAPSDNLSNKYSRWNLKISHNFFFLFFPVRFQAFLFLVEVKMGSRRKTGEGRGGGEKRKGMVIDQGSPRQREHRVIPE